MRTVAAPARPGRADIDPLLAGPLRRIVVAGSDADLAAVLVRLLRRDRLDVELAYVPADRRSAAARLWGLPHGAAAVELAHEGVGPPGPAGPRRRRRRAGRPGRDPRHGRVGARRGVLRRGARAARIGPPAGGDAVAGRHPDLPGRHRAHAPHDSVSAGTSSTPHPPRSRCARAAGAVCPTAAVDRYRRPPARAGARPSAAPSRWAACPPPWCTTAWSTRGPSRGGPGTGTSPTGCSSDDDGGHTHFRRTVVPATG